MSDTFQIFQIPKATGTHADVLAAVGLADLLASVPSVESVRLIERQDGFEVLPPRQITEGDIRSIPQVPGYLFLKPNAKTVVPSHVSDFVDYTLELDRVNRYYKQREDLRKRGIPLPNIEEFLQSDRPREDWDLWRALNNLQGDETANRVYNEILGMNPDDFHETLRKGLASIQSKTDSGLKWNISQCMVFHPTSAKGYREPKPAGTRRKTFKIDEWGDPFLEWLKYRGFFAAAIPRLIRKDVRILIPVPSDISLQAFMSVVRGLRKGHLYGGPPKVDVLAILRLAELLVRHSEEYHAPADEVFPGLFLHGKSPTEAISGIMVTHYQSLGNAKAVSAISTLALPGWFVIESHQDADDWLVILNEHQRIIRGLQDDHSDEIGLLIAYRRFLERRGEGSVWALLEFMGGYGPFVMRANGTRLNGRMRWTSRFTDVFVRRILMGMDGKLSQIIDDPGFEAVARAVRQATVTAQNRRARREDVWREIRYDLLHDLHRTRKVPGYAMVECITEFISHYNRENARRREEKKNPKAAPANVSDEELRAFLALIDLHGASLVGALLAAYGSCKDKWEPEEVEVPDSAQTQL